MTSLIALFVVKSDKSILLVLVLTIQVQLMVPGVPGLTGLHVPRTVVEELRRGGDSVTLRPRSMVVLTVRGMNPRRERVTLTIVFQVNKKIFDICLFT